MCVRESERERGGKCVSERETPLRGFDQQCAEHICGYMQVCVCVREREREREIERDTSAATGRCVSKRECVGREREE